MYQVSFPAQSNRASWVFIGQIMDLGENLIDISACSMAFAIREKNNGSQRLEATTANGKLTIVDLGTFRWFFTKDEMGSLCPETYETGLTLTNDDGTQTVQLSVGPLPIVDGVVP